MRILVRVLVVIRVTRDNTEIAFSIELGGGAAQFEILASILAEDNASDSVGKFSRFPYTKAKANDKRQTTSATYMYEYMRVYCSTVPTLRILTCTHKSADGFVRESRRRAAS